MTSPSGSVRLRQLGSQLRAALPAGVARDRVDAITATADQPVRIAVIGRVSTGKSTLVNALLGRAIAATAAQDCTKYPTVYTYGAPERAVAVDADGRRTPLPLDLAQADPPTGTAWLEVTLQTSVLRGITLLDSPGLAGTATAAEASRAPELIGQSEILLYLFRGELRTDDTAVLDDLAEAIGAVAEGALPAVGVLAHADNFGAGGWGDDDPIDLAAQAARQRLDQAAGRFHRVVPFSSLMAETVRTGRLTEGVVRRVRRLADADPTMLQYGVGAPVDDPTAVADLTGLLTGYGLNRGRRFSSGSARLADWMLDRSGYRLLLGAFDGLQPMVAQLRLARALREYHEALGSSPAHTAARAVLERETLGPIGHLVRELRVFRLLAAEQPDHPMTGLLRDLLTADHPAERLHVLRSADPDGPADDRALCHRLAARYQAASGLTRSGAEAEAARTLSLTMLYLGEEMN